MKRPLVRWMVAVGLLALVVVALAAGRTALAANNTPGPIKQQVNTFSFTFDMVPSTGAIKACLPDAKGTVTITKGSVNDELTLHVVGLARNTGYDLFVLQVPHAPFGISWYQSDLETNPNGEGTASVRGIFNIETFSISPATLTTKGREGNDQTGATFGAVNMYHLGLWFNDPQVPFNLGCEPGQTKPVVTPFNGEQNAGIQVLNTSNFPDNAGPLRNVPA
ncbi:MAG TPA: hypothetical protein VH540_20195 [Ktedonobacterales bacterium]